MPLSRLLAPALLVLALPVAHAQTSISLGLRLGLNAASRSGTEPISWPDFSSIGTSPGTHNTTYSQDYTRSAVLAPQFGAVLDVRFGKLGIQPAVLLSQKGADQRMNSQYTQTTTPYPGSNDPSYTDTSNDQYHFVSRPNYLEIPVNLVYTFGGDNGFQLFGGPYVAFGIGGRAKLEAIRTYNYEGFSNFNGSIYKYGTTTQLFQDAYPNQPNTSKSDQYFSFDASSGAIVSRRFDAGLNLGVGYRQGPLQVQLGYGLGLINQQPAKASYQRDDLPAYYQRVTQLTATYFLKVK